MAFRIDTRQLRRFERDLHNLNKRGLPHATRSATNTLAFNARKEWQREIADVHQLRNKHAVWSIRVEKATGTSIRRQRSKVGSVADYMGIQQTGGTLTPRGEAKAIPVDSARIGKSNKRLVSRPNQAQRIKLYARRSGSESRRNADQIYKAKRKGGHRFALIEKHGRKGIFKVKGGKRKTKLELIQDLTHRSARIAPHPTMQPAVLRTMKRRHKVYAKALLYQLRTARTFKR